MPKLLPANESPPEPESAIGIRWMPEDRRRGRIENNKGRELKQAAQDLSRASDEGKNHGQQRKAVSTGRNNW
jgi:hypothetical protein